MNTLRRFRTSLGGFMTALIAVWQVVQPLQGLSATTYYWDTDGSTAGDNATTGVGLGGAGTWDTSTTNWTDLSSFIAWVNSNDSFAFFTGTPGTVTLGAPITAGGLTFNNAGSTGYTLTGSTLTLAAPTGSSSPVIAVNNNGFGTNQTIIASTLAGTSGLSKTGNGTLRLTADNSATLSGDISIKGGNVVISNPNQLGSLTGTAISVTGIANTGSPGYSGGSLVLAGTTTNAFGGFTLNREVSVSGRGPGAANASGGLVSVGYNTLAGGLTLGSGASEGRAVATHGITTITGTLYLGIGNADILYGNGNWIVSGQVIGIDNATDRFIKTGTSIPSTLWLQNSANSFAETVRIDSGTVRVSVPSALGVSTVTSGATGSVDLNGAGTTQGLEIRTDTNNWSTIGVRVRGNSNGITVDHGIGSYGASSINQTIAFGNVSFDSNSTLQVNGRNGFNTTFSGPSGTITWSSGNPMTWNNLSNGTMTINASISRPSETTARTLTLNGTGEIIMTGNILEPTQGTGSIALTKSGSGVLTLQGTAGTYTGSTTLSAGTLSISDIGAINANSNAVSTGRVVFGGGTLNYTGSGQTWTNKVLLLNATNNILTNNGSGALVLQQNVGNNGTGVKTLVLGGANTGTNDLQGLVVNTTAGAGVTKFDSGTWQISSPGTTAATIGTAGALTITAVGTTASQTITTTSTAGLVVGQPVSGTGVPFGTVISQIISSTQFAISQAAASTGTTVTLGTVTGSTSAISVTANTANLLTVASTANLVVGQPITGPGMTSGGWYISAINSATTFTVANTTGAAALANSAAIGSQTPSLAANFAGPLTITGGTTVLNQISGAAVLDSSSNVVFAADTIRNNGYAAGTLNFKPSAGGSQTAGILSVTAGAGTVQMTGTSGTNTLTFGSLTAPSLGTSLNFVTSGAGTNNIVLTAAPALGLLNAHAYFNGADFAYNPATTTSTLRAPVYGTDAGFNTVAASASLTSASNNLINGTSGTSGAVASGAVSITSLKITGNNSLNMTGNLTVGGATGGGVLVDSATTGATISGTGITTGGAGDLVFRVNGASDILTLSAPMLVGTTGGFTKNGAGTLILNAVNAEAAATINVNEGTLKLSGATTTLGASNMNLTLRQGTTFDVNGVNVAAANLVTGTATNSLNILAGAGTITNGNATTSTITVGNNNGSGIFSGIIQDGTGKIALNKAGSGTETLTGLNTFTGPLTFTGGTIAATTLANIGVASSIGKGDATSTATNQASIVFASGTTGTIQYTGASANVYQTTQTPSISIDRLFTITGGATGTIDSSGQFGNNTAAASSANNATLVFNNTNPIAYTGSGTATLGLAGTSIGDNRFVPQLANSNFALTKSGVGLWILDPASANTYGGATTITGGALQAVDGVGLSSNSVLTLNGGVFQTSGTFTRALGSAAGQVQFTGNGGFAASTSKLTVNLGSGATLNLGTAPTAGSTIILSSTTALADVELVNPINLGTAARTIQVDDNGSTGLDFATTSGVISGGAGGTLTKTGGGTLIVGNANTYVANTILNNGSLVVTSIGASGATATSIGTNVSGGILQMGATTNTPNLLYVGPGETTTRQISFVGTTGTNTIDSSGSGALVLTNVANNVGANAFTFQIRGTNTDNNMITSQLTQTGANAMTLTKSDGGVWILNPSVANTFTGNINANGGMLGLTANGIGSAANVALSNGGIFAYGGALTTSTNFILSNNAAAVFGGSNNITVNGTLTKASGANDQTFSNNLENGAILTFNGTFINGESTANATRTINMRGFGATVFNGVIQNNTTTTTNILKLDIRLSNDGSVTLNGDSKSSTAGFTGGVLLGQGTLTLGHTGALGPVANNLTLDGGVLQSNVDLSTAGGGSPIANAVFLQGDPVTIGGSNNIEFSGVTTLNASRLLLNNLTSGKTLTISGGVTNTAAATLTILGSGATLINSNVGTGTGAQGLAYSGTGTLSMTGTNTSVGALTVNRSTVTLSGTAGGSWNAGTVVINPTGTLTLDNSAGNNAAGRLFDTGAFTGQGGTLNIITNGTASSETTGALTLNAVQTKITMSGAGTNTLTFASATFANTGSSLDLSTISSLGTNNKVLITAALPANALINNIMPRTFVNGGADFATYNAVSGVQAFASYNVTNNLNTAAATDTLDLTASAATTANRTVNAVKLDGGGVSVGGAASNKLTLNSAAILNAVGNNSLDINQVDFVANTGFIQVAPTTTLTVNSGLTGSNGLAKALTGTLTFGAGARSYVTSTHNILEGTVNLNGAVDNFFPNQALAINVGATLNLNGGGQYVGALSSTGVLPGTGGSITGGGALVTNANGTFGGVISGASTNFARVANSGGMTFESAQTYGGVTMLMGNTTTLENDASLLNTSSIAVNGGATLSLSNNSSLQTQNSNRVGDSIPLNLNGGTISVTGRVDTAATESFGVLTSAQGANAITATAGGTGTAGAFNSLDLTFAGLTRSAGTTVNFSGTNLGQQGNNARIVFASPLTAVGGGVIGAWAIANSNDYAAYNSGTGVGVVGAGGYTGYDATFASGNITEIPAIAAATTTTLSGSTTTALLKIAGGFQNDIAFTNAGDTLTLQLGGILRSNNNNPTTIGTAALPGVISSGTSELVVYNAQNTLTINSQITGATGLVKSGAGTLALSNLADNYSLGTTVSQGTLTLNGGATANGTTNVVIPAGGLTITNATVTMVTNAGQIASSNAVTLNGGAVLTLVGNNTLSSVSFNNNGGTATPTVTSGGILTLTGASPIQLTASSNPAFTPTIAGTVDIGSGSKTINTPAIQVGGVTVTNIVPALSITAGVVSPGASLTKTGNGLLQVSGASTFSGLNVTAGGIVVGASSTQNAGTVTSGPLGVGSVSMASGTSMLTSGTFSIGNSISFAGTPTFDSTANTAWTLSLTGALSGTGLSGGTPTVQISNPGLTVALLGTLPAMSNITKTGLGTLIFNATNYTGNFNATALGNPNAVSLINDGDGTGSVQTLSMGSVIFDAGIVPNITVNRGGSLPFPLAVNKILAPASVSNTGLGITVTNSNGYGLKISDATAFTGTPTISVATATASNVTQGLYLSGDLTGTGFNKTGAGTVVINNSTPANNTFTGNINITQGVLSVGADTQLGNSGNLIVLNPSTGTSAFRATGSFSTSRVIQLANTANIRAIDVSSGNTLTLNSSFDLNAGAGATAALNKQDLGTLVINASNTGWSGQINITEGAILVNNPALTSPLGTGVINASTSNVIGSALQLAGGVTLNNPLTLQGTNNVLNAGINFQGVLDNVSGTNTYAGAITMGFDTTIGARAGSTLNITGGIVGAAHRLQFNAEGDINVTTNPLSTALYGMDKFGAGTLTFSVPITPATSGTGILVHQGTLRLNGTATMTATTGGNIVYGGAFLTLDNSVTNTNNRLVGKTLTLQGGQLNFIGNNSTETVGAFTNDQGANTINMTGTGTTALTFASLTSNAGSTLNVTGTFGTATNFLKFTSAPALTPATTGILNRVTVNGNELASYSSSLGVIAFTGYSTATNILGTTATQTFKATTSTLNSLTGNQTLNAITINNTAAVGGLGGLNPAQLTLTSGTILANGSGGASLNTPIVALGAEGLIHVQSGQSLTVNSGMTGTAGLTKDLSGTLNINAQQFVSGTTYINGGSVVLTSTGITNPMLYNQALAVNYGGTLDLGGNNQFVAGLSSATAGGGNGIAGGTVTNTSGTQSIFTINGNTNFAGVISGNIYLNKTGTGALNLQSAQTYTGPTLITGGTLTLNDNGALPNSTQPIYIYYGGLSLANGNLYNVNNRVNDSAPITMAGGTLAYAGRQQLNSTETLGAVTLTEGLNYINATNGGTNVNSAVLTLASLTRSVGSTATLRFNGNSNSLGAIGSTPNVIITSAPTLTNNILGPWAIVDREWASYDSTYGIGQLNQNGFAGYSATSLSSNPTSTDNVRFATAGTTVLGGNTTVGTLNFASQTAATVLDLGGNALTVQGGGVLFAQATDSVDFSIQNGTIKGPSGGGDLYLTHANYAGTNRTVTLNAPIADNGGATRVIFTSGQIEAAGVGNTTINSVNTYTGGTVINSGNIVLGATGQLGTGGLTVNQGIFTQTAGGVIPSSNTLTLGGGSLVNLAGNNTLAGITVNNLGGAAPTVNPTGVLTLTGGITSTSVNAGNAAVIGTGTIDLNGAGSYSINVGAALVNGVQVAPWGADLTINATIQNGGIVKSGAGMLQLGSTTSTFTGGVTVNAGGIIIGASSSPNTYSGTPGTGTVVTNGPLGTGTLTLANNSTVVSTGANTVANALTILDSSNLSGPGSGTGSTVFNGTNNITFNGVTTLPETWNATVTAPQMIVTIADASPSDTLAVINKYGLGTLSIGNYSGTIYAAGGLVFSQDGNTLGTPENVSTPATLNITADTAITVNHSGSAPNARNKNIQEGAMTDNGSILAVQNLNGYGLEFTGTTTFTGASHMSVANATASNLVQGLTLSGVVSDTGGYSLVKSGAGTLALTNAGNTFGGPGATIDILNGIVAVNSDGALGDSNNTVTLDVDGTSGIGLRATGTFSTARTIIFNALNNAMEVTAGNTLTVTAPFSLAAGTGVAFAKNDNGILAINASNSTWTGAITINAGAIQVQNNSALGTGAISIPSAVGAALQLAGGATYSNPITFAVTGLSGINSAGVIEAVSGNDTFAGLITQTNGTGITIGADAGATLNITGGIATVNSTTFNVGAGGTINLSTVAYGNGLATGNNFGKIGAGSLFVSVASPAASASAILVSGGTLTFNGAGLLGTGTTANALVDVGATLTLDNSSTLTANRLGGTGRTLQLRGGNFNLIGNASNTTEALGAPTFSRGYSVVTVTAVSGGGQANLTFGAAANNVAPAQNASTGPSGASVLFRGTSLGNAAGSGIATIANSTGGFTFNGQTGAAASTNKGILPWALVDTTTTGDGSSFATADTATSILRPLAANEYAAANTFSANNNIKLTTGITSIGAATLNINSLTMSGGSVATIGGLLQLTSSSGGILVTSGSSAITGGVLNQVNSSSPFNIWTPGTASLTISSLLSGGNGVTNGAVSFVKAGAGTLTLITPTSLVPGLTTMSANSMSGQTVINQGTLVLSGGKNTLLANNFLAINGGMLDLNGNSQQILSLFTDGAVNGAGGIITSSSGTGNLVINQDNAARSWAGSITGSVNVTRSGQNTLTIYSPQTYSGSTLINAGANTLRDNATLSNTASIDINYATLTADNNVGTIDLTDRINDSAAITLRGGTLALQGRALTASSETVGTVTLAQSNSFINSTVGGGTGINSSDLIIGNLVRTTGGGTVNFTAATGGLIGSSARVILNQINGVSTSTAFAGLTNNIIGGWAVIGTSDFATYVPGLGVAAMGTAGAPQYSNATSVPSTIDAASATDNVSINVAVTGNTLTVTNDKTLNSLRMGNIAAQTVNIAAGKTLTLSSGGLLFFSTASQTIGSAVNQGSITTSGPELFAYAQGTGPQIINSAIVGSGVTFIKSGSGQMNIAGTNTYNGGTVVNQGTLNVLATGNIPLAATPANGLVISGATVSTNAAGAIASGNVVTLNGSSTLNLWGNNTLAGVVFNNNGGTGTPVINTYTTTATVGQGGASGVLTIGSSGLTVTSSNVGVTPVIEGRVDFGTSANTITVGTIDANGTTDIAPLQAAFALRGVINSTGGITKQGNGVLQFNAQDSFTGAFTVAAGGIKNGVTNAGSRYSDLTLNSGTRYDLAGISTTWGSLSGSGTVFNSGGTGANGGGAATLTVGFDNNVSTTFSGQIERFNDANPSWVAITKVGTGTLNMTSAQSASTGSTGTFTIGGGTVSFNNAGAWFTGTTSPAFSGTFTVNAGGTLALDNTASNVNNRLGMNVAGALNLNGGTLTVNGNSSAATSEQITTFNITNGGGRVDLTTNASQALTFAITTLSNANGAGAAVFSGINGSAVGTVGQPVLTITTPALISGQGTGANGSVTMGVRHDILGDATVGGLGTGFLVKDSVNNTYRALASGELASAIALPLTTDVDPITAGNQAAGLLNVGLVGATQGLTVNSVANTLTVSGTSTVNSGLGAAFGIYGPGGAPLGLTLSGAAASLTLAGATGNISVGNFGSTTTGTTMYEHIVTGGTLNVNGYIGIGNTSGLAKADGGVLNFNNLAFYTGTTTIDDGKLKLSSGQANTIAVVPTAGAATLSALNVNGTGAILDLNGQNQAVGVLNSVNTLPGMGGTITSTASATFTTVSTANSTFAGSITGAVSLVKGNDTTARTLTLTSANTYTGSTTIRGGTLQLRDSGSISSTAGITANYGTILWDNFGLNPNGSANPVRIAAANPVTLQGGTFTLNGAGSTDTTATLNSVTISGGANTINNLPYVNEGSTNTLTIGTLNRPNTNHSGVNFYGYSTNNSSGVSTTGGQGFSTNGNTFVNALNFTLNGATTTAGSATITVASTEGLLVGATVTGTGLPANERVVSITDATHFVVTTGTGVTAQASTNLATSAPIVNLSIAGAVTTAGSNIVTVPSTAGLAVGIAITGTGLPANEFVTGITDATHFTITTGTSVTAQSSTTLTQNNLTNNLIGGWAVADGNTFATYVTNAGISVMGQTTASIVAPAFTATAISGTTVATGNYSDSNAAVTLASGAVVANSWRLAPGAAQTVTFPTTTTATLGVGLITNANFGITLAATDATNTITGAATASNLYFFVNQNTTAIQPAIVGNIGLVSNGPATLSLRPTFASNTYTGGTFVQGGTLNLSAGGAFIAIPGDLTVNNAAVTMSTQTNQIATTSNLFINGGGSVTLANYTTGPTQTLNSVTFTNDGGSANPTLSLGTPTTATSTLVLSSATPITASNNSLATTPTISTGAATLTALQFSNANPVITVNSGLAATGLVISAPITQNASMLTLTKSGTGTLALSGQNTFTTGFELQQGSLMFGAGSTGSPTITSGPVGTGTLQVDGGTTLLSDGTVRTILNPTTITGDFTFGGVTAGNGVILSGAMNLGATGRTITVSSPAVTSTISGAITSTASGTAITKAGTGILVLSSAANSLGGAAVAVIGGVLKNGIANAIPNSSNIAISAGAGYDLNNFDQTSQTISGNGFITNSANASKTLTLGGTSATDVATNVNSTFGGVITDNILSQASSRLVLTKVGIGSLTLTNNNTFAGGTNIVAGSVIVGVDNALPVTGAVTIGTGNTGANTATLDLSNFNQTIGSLNATSTIGTGSGNIVIGSGKTLTVTGAVTVGVNGSTTTTNLNATGAGTLSIGTLAAPTNANVQIGNNTTSAVSNGATMDLSGLGTFYANLGTGSFRIGDPTNSAGTATLGSTLILAANSTITATALTASSEDSAVTEAIKLGSGTNRLNVNTINIGAQNGRSNGSLSFNTGTGTLTVRGLAGGAAVPDNTSRADLNVVNNVFNTGATPVATFDTTGHVADLLLGTVTIAGRTSGAGNATGTFSFDSGTLDANNLIVGTKASGSTATTAIAGTVNLSGGTATFNNTTGPIALGVNASTTAGVASGTFNVSGTAAVTVAASGGNSFVLGNATAAGGTATGIVNVTGGSLTVAGDIIRGATTGTSTASLTLNGGTLDMGGKKIGGSVAAGNLTSLTFASGTLQNLAEINNGAVLTKTTAGTLIMQGNNTYTGGTAINGGTLQVNSTGALGATGTLSFGGGTLQYTANNTTDYSSRISTASSQAVNIDTNSQNVTFSTALTSTGGSLTKSGGGQLTLDAASTYSGATTVNGGTLQVGTNTNAAATTGSGNVNVNAGGTLAGTGTVGGAASTTTIASAAFLTPGDQSQTGTDKNSTMTIGGNLTTVSGGSTNGQIQLKISQGTIVADSGFAAAWQAGTTTSALDYYTNNPTLVTGWNAAQASTTHNYDFLSVVGELTLTHGATNSPTIAVINNGYSTQAVGDVFNLIDWVTSLGASKDTHTNGVFDPTSANDLALPSLSPGLAWDTTLFNTTGIIVVVPEPGRAMLLLLGLMGLALRRRRKM